jgi:hypothetical protein
LSAEVPDAIKAVPRRACKRIAGRKGPRPPKQKPTAVQITMRIVMRGLVNSK